MNCRWWTFFSIFSLIVFLSACTEKSSPEDQVRLFLSEAIAAAESREVLTIRGLISDDYSDTGGRDKRKLSGLTAGYFLRHKNIHLFTQVEEVRFPQVGRAHVEVLVAMAGSSVIGAQALLDVRADLYRFELTLVRESDDWRLQAASWNRASIEELLVGE